MSRFDVYRDLQPGMLVARTGRPPRVVRAVKMHVRDGHVRRGWLTMVILHCSWTERCTTTYCFSDLHYAGYRPVPGRVSLRRDIDLLIAECVKYDNRDRQILDCCDVEGVR